MPSQLLPPASQAVTGLPEDVLHGAVVRPPAMAWDGHRYLGATLRAVRTETLAGGAGVVATVQRRHFVGVVAVSAVHARQAAEALTLQWQPMSGAQRTAALAPGEASYCWSSPERAQGAGEVVVWCTAADVVVWLPQGAGATSMVIDELAALLHVPHARIRVQCLPGGVSPQVAPDGLALVDTVADAALLSAAVHRPVCMPIAPSGRGAPLVLAHADESPAPVDAAAAATALAEDGPPPGQGWGSGWQAGTVWAVRPSLARLCAEPERAFAVAHTAVQLLYGGPQYRGGGAPLSHASADVLNAALVFAQESRAHAQACAQGQDPLTWRLALTPDGPGRVLMEQTARRSGWLQPHQDDTALSPVMSPLADGLLHGRGFAAAGLQHPGGREEWAAWVVDVHVDPVSGQVDVARVVVGHDAGQLAQPVPAIATDEAQHLALAQAMVPPPRQFDDWPAAGPLPAVSDAAPRALEAMSDAGVPAHGDAPAAPLATSPVLAWPAAAAIGNAIYDACGVRLRTAPFDPRELRDALGLAERAPAAKTSVRKRGLAWLAGSCAAVASAAAVLWPAKPPIAPVDAVDLSVFSAEAIERGRLVAAAGDCIVCHTAPGGPSNAGGLALETPFGVIYSTNITPDKETGIGRWSYTAFERAMRQGVHQDGRQLYPAFPYTAFAKMTDADIQALYGYLMSQEPVRYQPPQTRLPFPFNLRFTLAGWNWLFHDDKVYQPVPDKSLAWNRGAYLVEGAGHCAACHSPRNALGAEKSGFAHYLAGGEAEGWDAPALNRLAEAPVPWTAEELYQYLRTGYSARHGVAAGPMAPVIHGLAELAESDVSAIVTYLMDLPGSNAAVPNVAAPGVPQEAVASAPVQVQERVALRELAWYVEGERVFQNACAACHAADGGPTLFGARPLMQTNTNIHAGTPDNLIQVILHGIQNPADPALGYMPGFKEHLSEQQVEHLVRYLRAEYAADQPPWSDAALQSISRIRQQPDSHGAAPTRNALGAAP
ncbi:hypothetical protein AAV94_06110 [Lampropedia cohaerens]|uniref:Cytochrome c domain-containing protein n=1 Tax=Lampropedia cohaerens TaxID=1610491 RepID=A0A0U1Q0E8_9BURK|nr:c-type cytochrome [Lampropedia cohaerens]KKW68233.1 hypothetical protein AAV94_06110 [Lampropedia cohaerens]